MTEQEFKDFLNIEKRDVLFENDWKAIEDLYILSFEIVTDIKVVKIEEILVGTKEQLVKTIKIAGKIHSFAMQREKNMLENLYRPKFSSFLNGFMSIFSWGKK